MRPKNKGVRVTIGLMRIVLATMAESISNVAKMVGEGYELTLPVSVAQWLVTVMCWAGNSAASDCALAGLRGAINLCKESSNEETNQTV